jgi:hypothetical protein
MNDAELGAALSSLDVAFPEPSVDLAALAVARIPGGARATDPAASVPAPVGGPARAAAAASGACS